MYRCGKLSFFLSLSLCLSLSLSLSLSLLLSLSPDILNAASSHPPFGFLTRTKKTKRICFLSTSLTFLANYVRWESLCLTLLESEWRTQERTAIIGIFLLLLIDHLHNYCPGLTGHPVAVGQSPAHESRTEQSETETRKTAFCSSETLKSYAGDWPTATGCPVSNPGNNCANGPLSCELKINVQYFESWFTSFFSFAPREEMSMRLKQSPR